MNFFMIILLEAGVCAYIKELRLMHCPIYARFPCGSFVC